MSVQKFEDQTPTQNQNYLEKNLVENFVKKIKLNTQYYAQVTFTVVTNLKNGAEVIPRYFKIG